jgi:hypothetical protein
MVWPIFLETIILVIRLFYFAPQKTEIVTRFAKKY